MVVFWFTLFLSVLFFFHFHHVAATTDTHHLCLHDERSALLDFKQSFSIQQTYANANNISYYHKTHSWKVGGDCCRSWDGVECDPISGHVIALDLSNNSTSSYLYGSLISNSSLFHLLHLQKLNLAFNDFSSSQIPSEIGLLSSLTYLNLSYSLLTGQIPSAVLHLSNLTSLDLSSPGLKLVRPNLKELVHNLTKLEYLHLSYVNISSTAPHALATYSSLQSLILSGCELQGEFPSAIFHLPRLHTLDLSYNPSLTGYLPESHSSSTSTSTSPLEELFLVDTNFSGEALPLIGNLSFLKRLELELSINFSAWPLLSASIGRLTNLTYLNLESNGSAIMGIKSSSFSWLAKLQKLTYLRIYDFDINGEIPSHIAGLTDLTDLYLSSIGLSGQLPAWFANLTQLVNLHLSYNQLSGHIPSSLSALTKLINLDVSYNQLSGHIPSSLSTLTRLENLRLEDNKLTGQVPSFFTNFTQLRQLYLSFNRFEGPLPNSFSNLKKLQELDLFSINLNGSVELDMFHKMKQLSVLHLSQNNLSLLIKDDDDDTHSVLPDKYEFLGLGSCNLSQFPTFLRNQKSLVWLDLSSNNIHGEIPQWIWNVSTRTLDSLNISHNFLTSLEDHSILLSETRLRTLDISFNLLQGSLPLPPLSINFYLASNNLWDAQDLSPHFCNLSDLIVLDVSNNKMSGMLPQCLSSQLGKSLQILNLKNNSIGGTIPESWVRGCSLNMINLSQNQFHGKVPTSLCNCTMLEFIDFGHNHIQDTFPSWLGGLSELRVLIMQSNKFHGVIENYEKDSKFPQLRILDLSYNKFSGNLSSMFFQSMNSMKVLDEKMIYMETSLIWEHYWVSAHVGYYDYSMKITNKGMERIYSKISNIFRGIDLSNNHFQGDIPASIGNLEGLHLLSLANNSFTGSIPSSFGNLPQLESLDLSHNKLSGKIPQELGNLNFLSFFDVSFNNLSGPIPRGGQFDTFENSSYEGNPGLIGDPNLAKPLKPSKSGSGEPEDPEVVVFDKVEWMVILIGFGGGLVVGVVLGNELFARKPYWFVKLFGSTKMLKWL